MNQCPAGPSVAVDERVDSLELRMCHRGLGDRRKRVAVGERHKVHHEVFDKLRGRGDERCTARVVVTATDPVLDLPETASVRFEPGPGKQSSMQVEQQRDRHRFAFVCAPDSSDHRVDVAEHLQRSHVARGVAQAACGLSA